MSAACKRINNELPSTSLLGDQKEPNVFNNSLNKPNGTSYQQIANEPRVVTLAVLENWINITTGWASKSATSDTGRSTGCFCASGWERAELLSDTKQGAFEVSCGRATRDEAIPENDHQRSTHNLRADPPDSGTLGGLKSEITD